MHAPSWVTSALAPVCKPNFPPPRAPCAETSAAKAADGSLVATFTAELPQQPNQLVAAPFDFVYAIGPLAPDGSLQAHFGTGLPYGGSKLDLPQPLAAGGGVGTPPPASEAPSLPGPPPAAASSPPPAAASSPPPAAGPPPAGETAGAAGGGTANCQLTIDGRQVSFEACLPIQDIGTNYQVMWSLEPASECTSAHCFLPGGGVWAACARGLHAP